MYRNLATLREASLVTLIQNFSGQKHDLEIRLPRASKALEAPDALGSRFLSKDYGPV